MRLDASTALPVSANRRRLYESHPPSPAFTAGNAKTQAIEIKHVINRELWAALQFPIGDDVSAYTRCKAA
jgi:IS1 family transposase